MIKKSKSSNKSKQKPSLTKQARQRRMIFRFVLVVGVLVGLFYTYRAYVIHRDVALLDQAEVKMRTIKLPPGGTTIFTRSCSVRSVKYGSPGNPSCGVSVDIKYSNSATTNNRNTRDFLKSLNSLNIEYLKTRAEADTNYYDITGLQEGLECALSDVLVSDYTSSDQKQHIYMYCHKKFMKQVYPVQ